MGGPYKVYNDHGDLIAGDPSLDDLVKATARDAGGYIEDADGEVVYGDRPAG
ncbi:hypothetical protein SEA_PASCHALIS_63 [Microbacterium phage Paschalis]|uniref:Uncharacterized protein n=1 Tax=Microbacterium phage Paschalis TaxID=2992928 RepID=A0A2U8UQ41_9CAUD|nr:hypothetical protein HOT30_gp64 [Microbacterium phage Paschalis]AWN05556.1 hypothetical protein SEA_PASCHALIS_63 [Microbacterium phage Paschalis]